MVGTPRWTHETGPKNRKLPSSLLQRRRKRDALCPPCKKTRMAAHREVLSDDEKRVVNAISVARKAFRRERGRPPKKSCVLTTLHHLERTLKDGGSVDCFCEGSPAKVVEVRRTNVGGRVKTEGWVIMKKTELAEHLIASTAEDYVKQIKVRKRDEPRPRVYRAVLH